LRFNVGASSFKRQVIPKIMKNKPKKHLQLAKERQNRTYETWKKIIFTDECPKSLSVPGNRQNDCVRALNMSKVEPVEKSKFSLKIMVCWCNGIYRGIPALCFAPTTKCDSQIQPGEHQDPFLLDDVNRTSDIDPFTDRRFHDYTLDFLFQQDGALVYTALSTQEWLQSNFPQFSDKNTWAPNSPDLSPIENIWVIIKERVNMSSPRPRDLQKQQQTVQTCWKKIDSETL
jgi:hypothetical protein